MGAEFAQTYPKIAARLSLDAAGTDQCPDPYVERLLEGFAFLAGRVQLQLQSEFPRFTQHLLDILYPNYLAPLPSMAIVKIDPLLSEPALAEGYVVHRGTILRSAVNGVQAASCEFRTAHEVRLWPLQITEAQYFPSTGALATTGVTALDGVRSGLRLRLQVTAGLTLDRLSLDDLTLHLLGGGDSGKRLYELIVGSCRAVVLRGQQGDSSVSVRLPGSRIRRRGFDDAEALLPQVRQGFNGYRLLQEYFALPERFLFCSIDGLQPALRQFTDKQLEIVLLFESSDPSLVDAVDARNFALHCTPVINLFPRRTTRIHLSDKSHEYHVVPDRTRPMDFEIHSVIKVEGFGSKTEPEKEFLPFYAHNDFTRSHEGLAFYTVHREPRVLSARARTHGSRSSYIGSEVYVSLVDGREAPYRSSLKQLEVQALCTNRDLPLQLRGAMGRNQSDFALELGGPIDAVICVAGPTRPLPSRAEGETAWRLLSHLSLNYLSLSQDEGEPGGGAAALRELLSLYADTQDSVLQRQIEGIKSVSARPITRRIPTSGPVTFGRGLEIVLTCDESAFEGTRAFLLGAVLEEFFSRYTTINSFTETVVRAEGGREVMRWPARLGRRHLV